MESSAWGRTGHKAPIKRSTLRLIFGRAYYTFRRRLTWLFGASVRLAERREALLEFEHAFHSTPLLRKLKDVDMQLQHNKLVNLRIAVPRINRVTLRPGETFSYWSLSESRRDAEDM